MAKNIVIVSPVQKKIDVEQVTKIKPFLMAELSDEFNATELGGAGSGNFNHKGVKGHRGGSANDGLPNASDAKSIPSMPKSEWDKYRESEDGAVGGYSPRDYIKRNNLPYSVSDEEEKNGVSRGDEPFSGFNKTYQGDSISYEKTTRHGRVVVWYENKEMELEGIGEIKLFDASGKKVNHFTYEDGIEPSKMSKNAKNLLLGLGAEHKKKYMDTLKYHGLG